MKSSRFTESDLSARLASNPHLSIASESPIPAPDRPATPREETKAGKAPKKGMTTPEREMSAMLLVQRQRGEIEGFDFESIKLSVGDPCCWYCCDFVVYLPDGKLRFIETKGPFIREDSMVKFRAAKRQYKAFEFQLWQRGKEGWSQLI